MLRCSVSPRIHSRNCASSPSTTISHSRCCLIPDLTVHKLYGAYGEKKLYGKIHVGVIRSTLVINPDGSVALARYNVRAKGHVDSLLKALDKLEK